MWQVSTLERIREGTLSDQFLAAMVASGIAFVIVSLLTSAPHGSARGTAKLRDKLTVPQARQPDDNGRALHPPNSIMRGPVQPLSAAS